MNYSAVQTSEPSFTDVAPYLEARPRVEPGVSAPLTACHIDALYYGHLLAVRQTHLPILPRQITALIGPSGCGKSTVLRCFNRMNDFVPGFRLVGSVEYAGVDIYDRRIDPVAVRRAVGMVFQQPNPFAMSIYDNVAFGLTINRYAGDHAERVEQALRSAALWDEVKDKLTASGLSLSGDQQQRLCISAGAWRRAPTSKPSPTEKTSECVAPRCPQGAA